MENLNTSVQGEIATPNTEKATTENASVDINTDAQVTSGSDNLDSANQEPVLEDKPKQDDKTNSAFAEMRRQKEALEHEVNQAKRDREIAKKYGKEYGIYSESDIAEQYGNQGISNLEQLENAIEAQQKNVDPELYQKLKDMEEKLNIYENEKQFKADHERLLQSEGSLYEKMADKAKELASQFNTDLETGYTLALREQAKELVKEPDVEKIKQDAIKEYIEKIRKGNAPVETSGSAGSIATGTPKTFAEAKANALSIFKAMKGQ